MSLKYYLFCREKYEQIIANLNDIIDSYQQIDNFTTNQENINNIEFISYELIDYDNDIIFFTEKKQHIIKLKNICTTKIEQLCDHEFEDDLIDILPDKSMNIKYCRICGYTK
jgi:hypothetical protein